MAEKTDFTRGRKSTFRGNGGGNRDATQLGNIDAEVIKYIPKDDMVVVRTTGPVYRAYNGGEIIAPAGSLIAISYEALKAEEGKQFKGTLRNLRTLRDGTQMKYGTGDAMPAQFDKDGNESPTGGSICSFQRVSMPTGNAPTATVNVGGEDVTLPLVTAGIVAGLVSSQQKLIDTRDKDNNVETVPGFAMIPAGDSYISLSSPKYDMDKLDQHGNPRKEQFATVIMSGKGNTRAFSDVNELSDLLKDRAENGMLDMGYADIPLADIATPAAFITAYRKPSDDLSEEAIAEHYADPSNVVTMVVPMFPRWQPGEGDEPGHPYFDVEHSLNRSVEFADPDGDGMSYALQHPEEFDFVMADAARIEIAPSQIPDKVMPGKEAGPKTRYQINNAPRSVIYDPEDGKPMQNGYLKVGQGIALVATPSAFYTDKDGKNVTIEKLSFAALKEVADPENSEYPDTAQVRIGKVGARNVMDAVSRLAPMPDGKSVSYNTPIFADQIPQAVPEGASPSLKQAIEASQAATNAEKYEEKGGKLVYTEGFSEFGKEQTANRSAHIKNLLNPAAKENKASDPAP